MNPMVNSCANIFTERRTEQYLLAGTKYKIFSKIFGTKTCKSLPCTFHIVFEIFHHFACSSCISVAECFKINFVCPDHISNPLWNFCNQQTEITEGHGFFMRLPVVQFLLESFYTLSGSRYLSFKFLFELVDDCL